MTQFSPVEQTYQSNDRITDDVHPWAAGKLPAHLPVPSQARSILCIFSTPDGMVYTPPAKNMLADMNPFTISWATERPPLQLLPE